jgi:Glycosyltransferase family 87
MATSRFWRLPRYPSASVSSKTLIWIWIAVWIVTRALMVVQVGFWNHTTGVNLQDVNSYESWSNYLAEGHMPTDEGWQYPPGAAFVMLLPRIGGAPFGQSFVATMLLFDLAGLALIAILAKREHRDTGVWVWLLAMPLLQMLPVLRFDLVPTVFAIAALVVIHRRPGWFGFLAGLGASVKVWPIAVLFGEWQRRRLALAAVTALATIAATFLVAGIAFGEQSTFFDNQGGRGLEIEAVAASPWYVRQMVTGEEVNAVGRHGSVEVGSGLADTVAGLLKWLALAVLIAAALWWLARERAIRRGRTALADAAVSRDFVFTLVLLLTVVSRVLSIQYMIWLVGLSAVILTAGSSRLARPAWVVIGAVVLSAGLYQASANMVIRNLALLVASIDAAIAMYAVLREPEAKLAGDGRADRPEPAGRQPERQLRRT